MKRKVYIETSVISYLTARPSKAIIGAAHQQITQAWWEMRNDFENGKAMFILKIAGTEMTKETLPDELK